MGKRGRKSAWHRVRKAARASSSKFSVFFQGLRIFFGALSFLVSGFFLLLILALFIVPSQSFRSGNVAVIPISGPIVAQSQGGTFAPAGLSSKDIVDLLKDAEESEAVAVILEINSPGGSPVASDEIVQQVKRMNKTVYSVIRELGASGAYWVASASDRVYANRMSITGSIGVIGSSLGFEGLLTDYNVTYRRLVAGKYKDAGSPFKEFTEEEQALIQRSIDQVYDIFVEDVADNRGLSKARVEELATGQIYLGVEAIDLGLVDRLGGMEEVVDDIEQEFEVEAKLVEYQKRAGFGSLFGLFSDRGMYFFGKGFASVFVEQGQSLPIQT